MGSTTVVDDVVADALSNDNGNSNLQQQQQSVLALGNEVLHKIEASLLVKIDAYCHKTSSADGNDNGVDLLHTKIQLLLSYLIDLIVWNKNKTMMKKKRNNNSTTSHSHQQRQQQWERLIEMKLLLDKMRTVLEKPLQYQINKLLAYAVTSTASTVTRADVAARSTNGDDDDQPAAAAASAVVDPLMFRPNYQNENDGEDDEQDQENSDDDEEEDEGIGSEEANEDDDDDDDDLIAARQTLAKHKLEKKKYSKGKDDDNESSAGGKDGIYRAPRLTAAPYPHNDKSSSSFHHQDDDNDDSHQLDNGGEQYATTAKQQRKLAREEKFQKQRLRASDIAETLRATYHDGPESDDVRGGTNVMTQQQSARRFQQRHSQKTKFEEDHMIRLTVTRSEKKERKRLLRQEQSNLQAMTDLGTLAGVVVSDNNTSSHRRPSSNNSSKKKRRK